MGISTAQLTETTLEGVGVFDVLMRGVSTHLENELSNGRIKGSDYSQVYLGAMTAVLQQSTAFLLSKDKAANEADLVAQQVVNAAKELEVLHAQKCELEAKYDVLLEQKLKVVADTALIGQKKLTEGAQISAVNVDDNSVVGKQKALYGAQTKGFQRDAEQKAAKVFVDAFGILKTTDPTHPLTGNGLENANIADVLDKLRTGLDA